MEGEDPNQQRSLTVLSTMHPATGFPVPPTAEAGSILPQTGLSNLKEDGSKAVCFELRGEVAIESPPVELLLEAPAPWCEFDVSSLRNWKMSAFRKWCTLSDQKGDLL